MKNMDPAELVKQPQDVTENPYRKPMKDKPPPSMTGAEVCVYSFDSHLVIIFIGPSNSSTIYSNSIHLNKNQSLPLLDLHSIHLLTTCFL